MDESILIYSTDALTMSSRLLISCSPSVSTAAGPMPGISIMADFMLLTPRSSYDGMDPE